MGAPDKIYIQPNAHDRWFDGNKPNDNFVEYIRKDALLEWAKEHKRVIETRGDDIISSKITHWMEIPSLKGGEE